MTEADRTAFTLALGTSLPDGYTTVRKAFSPARYGIWLIREDNQYQEAYGEGRTSADAVAAMWKQLLQGLNYRRACLVQELADLDKRIAALSG